ncbi:ribonuclease H-like domain-containing protein, partial [Tanacetum coccineum]
SEVICRGGARPELLSLSLTKAIKLEELLYSSRLSQGYTSKGPISSSIVSLSSKSSYPYSIGYGTQLNEMSNKSEMDSEISMSVFEVRSSDEEITPADDRLSKADGYHAFPPPITRNFLTPRANISFAGKTNEVNVEKPKSVYESVVSTPNIKKEKVIIEDWNSDDENDMSDVVTTSPVRTNETQTVRTKVDKINQVNPVRPNANTVRPQVNPVRPNISTARSVGTIRPIYLRMDNVRPRALYSPIKRAVANTSKGKMENALKKSRQQSLSLDYEDYNGGFIAFGSDPKGGKIAGKGKIKTANLDFDDVYFVEELKFNLFSVSQMCDKKNSILFTNTEYLILSPSFKLLDECQVVLRAARQNDVYNLDLKNIVPSGGITCLYVNATSDESKLWHKRLGHVNFKNINKRVKGHLVRGLPSKVFVNDHTCVACKKGKQHKASSDLVGCDHGTKFKNYAMNEFSAKKGIKREFSVARTPQQNGVAERKNRTLIEAARTMLADSLLPIPFWAEVVNTACKPPSISFLRPFGCPLTILNTLDPLGKFDGKSDEGYLLRYSTTSKAFRVYNKRTKRVEENLHVDFLEHQPNVAGNGPDWMFDLDFLTNTMNYVPISVENQVTVDAGTQESYVVGALRKVKEPTQEYILVPLHPHRSRIPVEDVVQDAQEKTFEDIAKEKDRIVAQDMAAKAIDDATRQAFEEEKRNIASQKRAAQATSINILNTGRPSVSIANSPLVSSANIPYASAGSTPTGANCNTPKLGRSGIRVRGVLHHRSTTQDISIAVV